MAYAVRLPFGFAQDKKSCPDTSRKSRTDYRALWRRYDGSSMDSAQCRVWTALRISGWRAL